MTATVLPSSLNILRASIERVAVEVSGFLEQRDRTDDSHGVTPWRSYLDNLGPLCAMYYGAAVAEKRRMDEKKSFYDLVFHNHLVRDGTMHF